MPAVFHFDIGHWPRLAIGTVGNGTRRKKEGGCDFDVESEKAMNGCGIVDVELWINIMDLRVLIQ